MRSAGTAAMLAVAFIAWPEPEARGEEPEIITVRSSDCADLDVGELQRLLNVELAPAPGDPRPAELALRVRCVDDRIDLSVVDPKTGKELERSIVAPPRNERGRERIIALAVSELFETAWLDLLVAPEPARIDPEPPPVEPAPPPEPAPPSTTPPKPARRDAITIGVALAARRIQAPLPTGGVALGYGGWLRP